MQNNNWEEFDAFRWHCSSFLWWIDTKILQFCSSANVVTMQTELKSGPVRELNRLPNSRSSNQRLSLIPYVPRKYRMSKSINGSKIIDGFILVQWFLPLMDLKAREHSQRAKYLYDNLNFSFWNLLEDVSLFLLLISAMMQKMVWLIAGVAPMTCVIRYINFKIEFIDD